MGGVDAERTFEVAPGEVGSAEGELRLSGPVQEAQAFGLERESGLECLEGGGVSVAARLEIGELAVARDLGLELQAAAKRFDGTVHVAAVQLLLGDPAALAGAVSAERRGPGRKPRHRADSWR